jgi:predicted metal-binding membrane protein
MTSGDRASWHAFTAVSASIFAVGAALTAFWCASMQPPAMMSMPGGWTMSMAWMRMPGQTWPGAAASFLGMWTSMMVAMMLPALAPPLWAYQRAIAGSVGTGIGGRTTFAGTGYFVVWIAFGMTVYPVGAGFAAIEMRQPSLAKAVPAATGVAVIVAGLLQFTAWKMRQLACCREMSERGRSWAPDVFAAWR